MTRTKVMNPVLPGFNPDPSIVRVGEDYYIANSTFEYFPGVQIHHSKDLVNWKLIKRPLDTAEHLDMIGNPKSGGIWAPCLSHDGEMFYLIFTDVKSWSAGPFKDTHNYVTTAKTIEGPWTKPVYLNSTGFDASLFHDGHKKWYVDIEWDHRKPTGSSQFSGILLQEFDAETMSLVGPVTKIFKGTERGLVEGPHMLKKDGYYYLTTAEGGTSYNHAITVARSKKIEGPYEVHPNLHLVTSKDKPELTIQRAGHGQLVATPEGKWYTTFLSGRPLPGTRRCVLGRETSIQEVEWKEDWPYLVNGTINPDDHYYVDGDIAVIPKAREVKTTFQSMDFLDDFQTLRLPYSEEVFSINPLESGITIRGMETPVSNFRQATLVRRQEDFVFEAETELKFSPDSFLHMAGLIYRYDETNFYYLYASYDEEADSNVVKLLKLDQMRETWLEEGLCTYEGDTVYLKLKVNGAEGKFFYGTRLDSLKAVGSTIDTTILSDEYTSPEGFTGAFVGITCQDLIQHKKTATFKSFTYRR